MTSISAHRWEYINGPVYGYVSAPCASLAVAICPVCGYTRCELGPACPECVPTIEAACVPLNPETCDRCGSGLADDEPVVVSDTTESDVPLCIVCFSCAADLVQNEFIDESITVTIKPAALLRFASGGCG